MKIIDDKFNEKKIEEKKDYELVYDETLKYLRTIITDDKIWADILKDSNNIIIQEANGEKYLIKTEKGDILSLNFPSSAGALTTSMNIELKNDGLEITPGVALRKNFNKHQLIHEFFHAISTTQNNHFDKDGIVMVKIGTKVNYYDKDLNHSTVDNTISSNGLNEGMTELLTSHFTNHYTGNYALFVVIARILSQGNQLLLKAYFSKDTENLEKFYADVEEKQSLITRQDLCMLNPNAIDEELIAKVIAGALEYSKAYNVIIEKEEFDKMMDYLDDNYILDSETWSELVSSFQSSRSCD